MTRFLLVVVLAAAAGTAAAQDPPPPTTGGKKSVSVDSEVLLSPKVSGYLFVQQVTQAMGGAKVTYTKPEMSDTKPLVIRGAGRSTYVILYAVPEAKVKEYKSEQELFEAVGEGKVDGVARLGFPSSTVVDDTLPGGRVTWTYTVIGVDGKNIQTLVTGDGYQDPNAPRSKPPAVSLSAVEPGYVIAAVASVVVLALVIGGVVFLRGRKSAAPKSAPPTGEQP